MCGDSVYRDTREHVGTVSGDGKAVAGEVCEESGRGKRERCKV